MINLQAFSLTRVCGRSISAASPILICYKIKDDVYGNTPTFQGTLDAS